MARPTVHAAGGVITREKKGALQVLLIHRPMRGDWSFPKGKVEEGESLDQAALREVEEETGLTCKLRDKLGETAYVDAQGRDKAVDYWLMTVKKGDTSPKNFVANDEVDGIGWFGLDEADKHLTYKRDRLLLQDNAEVFAAL